MKKLYTLIGIVAAILVFVFRDLVLSFLIGGSKKVYNDALKKDSDLRKESDDLNRESEVLREKANELTPEKVDENWHEKK